MPSAAVWGAQRCVLTRRRGAILVHGMDTYSITISGWEDQSITVELSLPDREVVLHECRRLAAAVSYLTVWGRGRGVQVDFPPEQIDRANARTEGSWVMLSGPLYGLSREGIRDWS